MAPIQLLVQMLPLIVFIIVDSVFDNVGVSILSAIVFAAAQLVFFYVKTGRFDWFVLLDAALIAGLGTVSIVCRNDLFFKVKPAVIEAATVIFFIVMIVLPDRFLAGYFGRMMPKGMVLRPGAIGTMKMMLIGMSVYVAVHIGAVLYTAFYASRRVWAFVSGPGFYLLFIPVLPVLVVKARKRRASTMRRGPSTLPF